jgi:hypothetical protein
MPDANIIAGSVHATLSASGAYRWWTCLGSPRMEAEFPASTSIYAAEGTAAHELAHLCLINGQDAAEYVDRVVADHTIDAAAADNVQVYLDVCRVYIADPDYECFFEKKFSLESLHPPVPMFGTSDFVALSRRLRRLVVIDYKHGRGVVVEVEDNPQLKYYALGAMLAFPRDRIDEIETIVVQPRAGGAAVRRCSYDSVDILGWSVALIERAELTMAADAPLTPGDHCGFCRASGGCPAQAAASLAVAQMEFADVLNGAKIVPPDTSRLSNSDIGILLHQAEALDEFVKGLRATAQRLIEHGEDIPGWKIVPKRASRKWKFSDPPETAKVLAKYGLTEATIWTRDLVSPAQAEAALAKSLRVMDPSLKAKDAEIAAKDALRSYIASISSGGNLAPDDDVRPALPTRGHEFEFDQPADAVSRALPGRTTDPFGFEESIPARVNP